MHDDHCDFIFIPVRLGYDIIFRAYLGARESDVHKVISVKINVGRLLIRIAFEFNKQTV